MGFCSCARNVWACCSARTSGWLVSGDAELKLGERMLDVLGRLQIDAAYWELARSGTPQLSDDVLIKRGYRPGEGFGAGAAVVAEPRCRPRPHFHFRGAGVESRLVGA
jgi:translocation and assembly module TamB